MMFVKSSFSVLLGLGMVSQLCARGPGDWEAADDKWLKNYDMKARAKSTDDLGIPGEGWLKDYDLEARTKSTDDLGAPGESWLKDNEVEPSRPRADSYVASKALVKALLRFIHQKALRTQELESVTKGKDFSELRKTTTEHGLLMVPGTTPVHHHNMMENDKSHRFTHSIRFGYGAHYGSLL